MCRRPLPLLLLVGLSALLLAAPPEYPDRLQLMELRDSTGKATPIRTPAEWAQRREQILAGMQEVMGPLPDAKSKVELDVKIDQEWDEGAYTRRLLSYQSEKGNRVPAYLLVPKGKAERRPAMLCLHQTTRIGKGEPAGLGGLPDLHYAKELAQRGFVCLVPDYPSFGDYAFDFGKSPHPSGTMQAIWNNIRGVDLLVGLPEVDAERIGVIGHSLGGHNALFTAAFEPRLKVVVTSCGFTRFPRYYGGNLKGWTSDRYMPRIASTYDLKPEKVPFDFPEILGAIAPRGIYICAPTNDSNFDRQGVEDCVKAAQPVFALLGAKDRLEVEYPQAPHTFPKASREAAYRFVAKVLSPTEPADIRLKQADDHLLIETDKLNVKIITKGYVSGTAAGGLIDKTTGARDLGFGLHIMDFLLAPGERDDGYKNPRFHGKIAKHYVEGPQICTQAKELKPEITQGKDWLAVRFRYTFNKPGQGYKAGSTWEQTLLFQPGLRYYLSSETITTVNDHPALFYRIDMPGHVKHRNGDTFHKVWLSYEGELPATAFAEEFAPDEKYLYQRREGKIPERMIRAYQVKQDGKPGPWLAGMTLDPAAVSEAWCHQRGYICFIQELHQRAVKAGDTFGAAYVVGWFEDRAEMERVYDRYKGKSRLVISDRGFELR